MVLSVIIKAILVLHMALLAVSQYLPPPYFQPPAPGSAPAPMAPSGSSMMMSPLQMPQFLPQRRFPVMMSPYHSKALDKKYMKRRKRRPKKYYSDSESSGDNDNYSSSKEFSKRGKQGRKKKRQVLTPVISYVTRKGRVVYQKKIKKENAGDWLDMGKKRESSKFFEDSDEK